jgi:hypothetical protein
MSKAVRSRSTKHVRKNLAGVVAGIVPVVEEEEDFRADVPAAVDVDAIS